MSEKNSDRKPLSKTMVNSAKHTKASVDKPSLTIKTMTTKGPTPKKK